VGGGGGRFSYVTANGKTQDEVTPPAWVTDTKMQAAFRKLPADERERWGALVNL
jgi:hypothetical protein